MAVSCLLSRDLLRSNTCGYSLKQITDLYLANYSDVTATEVGQPESGKGIEIKSITMASGKRFYHLEPAKDSATFTDSLQVGDGGGKYRQTEITWNIAGVYDAEMAETIDELSLGRFIIVAKLSDGNYVLFGRLTPLEATVANLESAAEATGFNGISLTYQNNTVESPLPLSAEAIQTVLKGEGV